MALMQVEGFRWCPVVISLTIFAFALPGNSFIEHRLHLNRESTCRKSGLKLFDSSTNRVTFAEEAIGQQTASIDRRAVLVTGASVAAGYFLKENILASNAPATLTTMESSGDPVVSKQSISSVSSTEEALKLIESLGDKRFLHAVVASDYKFLYEQSKIIPSDMDVEQIFSKKVQSINNSSRSVVLATTGNLGARKTASLWPLENSFTSGNDIHYAWPAQGGLLQSINKNDDSSTNSGATQAIIVDGIDCGKMSLEDALEGNMQVLVQAPTYLSVPSHMESSLRKGLQGAFLI